MWIDTKADVEENSRTRASRSQRVMSGLLLCTGDMKHVDKYMHGRTTFTTHCDCFISTCLLTSNLEPNNKLYDLCLKKNVHN